MTASSVVLEKSQGKNDEIESHIESLVKITPNLMPESLGNMQDMTDYGVNKLLQCGYSELQLVIHWARRVPGFSELLNEDQMALIKASFMELYVLRLSHRSLALENKVKFGSTLIISVEEAKSFGGGKELVSCTLAFILQIKRAAIFDNTEFCLLNALVLAFPDVLGLKNRDSVDTLQRRVLKSLQYYMGRTYKDQPKRYTKLLLLLPSLRSISIKAHSLLNNLAISEAIPIEQLIKDTGSL